MFHAQLLMIFYCKGNVFFIIASKIVLILCVWGSFSSWHFSCRFFMSLCDNSLNVGL
ncbi:hypothetical protein HMPREF1554_01940 [Porphyromonas gingivalis F0569]|nr:hypothetical protein HMPREF1554_01940 [Porphyromonas gingivalis F0569]